MHVRWRRLLTFLIIFADKVQSASYAKEAKQGKKLREAVYGNFKLMKRTLTNEQYKKYVQLLNVTFEKQRVGFLYGRCGE